VYACTPHQECYTLKRKRRGAVKAFRGRFSQQRFREFKQEAEMLQLVQGNAVRTPDSASLRIIHHFYSES